MNVQFVGSPNFTQGRIGNRVESLIIHWIDGNLAAADSRFADPNAQVSAHYGIEDDIIHQYVHETDSAWQAGDFQTNLKSIGIEHSAQPGRNASEATYQTSIALCTDICISYNLTENDIHPHNSIVPTLCPGTVDVERIKAGVRQALTGGIVVATDQDILNAYRGFYHRDPDPAGYATFRGKPVADMLQQMITSPEMAAVNRKWASIGSKPDHMADVAKLEEIKKTVDAVEGDLRS